MDASDAPKGLGARREFYAGRLEEANAGLLEALEETGDSFRPNRVPMLREALARLRAGQEAAEDRAAGD